MTIQDCFRQYERILPEQTTILRKGCLALRRSGLATMEELCSIQKSDSERLAGVRNIGPKTMHVIFAVCERYQRECGETKSLGA